MMLSVIGMFLGKNKKIIVILIAVVGIFGYYKFITHKISNLEQKLEEKIEENGILKNDNSNLRTEILKQNIQIDSWKEVSDQLEGNQQELTQKLTEMNKNTLSKITSILNETTPETCEAAIEYLKDASKELSAWDN